MSRLYARLLLLGLTGLLVLPAGAAEDGAAAPATVSTADSDWAVVEAVLNRQPEGEKAFADLAPAEVRDWFRFADEKAQALEAAVDGFAAQHPEDPRRLGVFVQLSYQPPHYITGFKTADDVRPSWGDRIGDEAKQAAFAKRQWQRIDTVLASPEATPREVGGAFYSRYVETRADFFAEQTEANRQRFLGVAAAMMNRLPDAAGKLAKEHSNFLNQFGTPAEQKAYFARLESSEDPDVQQMLAEAKGDFSRFDGIAELAFTAADGREVDLAQLRGKVVLIDFWATWCAPCVAEIPNVVANYEKYHDQGFEVIGITLENSGVRSDFENPANAGKLKMAKSRMLAFAQKKGMPWPQYYDGKFWQNEHAQRFGINAIPAMVLLGPDGKVVSIEARGEELEKQIRRLLQLDA